MSLQLDLQWIAMLHIIAITAIVLTVLSSGTGVAHAQSVTDKLQPLVETSARRLALGEQVALAKWDSGAPVEDPSREAQVIKGAVEAGELRGLSAAWVAAFFRSQIEANKVVQDSLLADWHRAGKAPSHTPIDLVTIRPELDQLQDKLIGEMLETADVRASSSCSSDVAKAVGRYVAGHLQDASLLYEIALDRALAATCLRQ